MYENVIDRDSRQFKAPFNQINNEARVSTCMDTAVVTPHSDTSCSFLWMDLRAEPVVLSVPAVDEGRYYSVQIEDGNTCNALQFAPAGPEEKAIREKLARIGVGPGKTFDFKELSLEPKAEVLPAVKGGESRIDDYLATRQHAVNGWKFGLFSGGRALFDGNWLLRAAGTKAGIYGNDAVGAHSKAAGGADAPPFQASG
jgi:hypothetical protein